MKFGAQLKSKSVPEWKSYNIDYNHLKFKIRITTESPGNNKEKLIQDLHNEFIQQIDMVNLFLNSKIGEVKRRLIYIENLIEQQQDHFSNTKQLEEGLHLNIETYLSKIASDLQKLSRFIMIQKTGLRKLLKKYTKYSGDDGDLNTKINKYMIKNNDSFIHMDLTGFYLELALIYDLIRSNLELQQEEAIVQSNQSISPNSKISSQHVQFQQQNQKQRRRSSYVDPSTSLNINELFDYEAVKDGNFVEKFLVHYDNLQELKLFLLANFYLVDESVVMTRKNIELKKQKSTLSLRQLIGRSASTEDLPLARKLQETTPQDEQSKDAKNEDERNTEVYKSNSIYLNESDELMDNTFTSIIMEDSKNFTSIKNESEPGKFCTKLSPHSRRTMLLSAIGGLRKTSCVLLQDQSFIKDLLESSLNGETYESFYHRHENEINVLSSLEKISIEWIYSKHVKPLIKAKLNKSRFTNFKTQIDDQSNSIDSSKSKSWISLKSNIKLSQDDLTTTEWTSLNETGSINVPYAILEVSWNSSSNVPSFLNKLLESHLLYNIDKSFNALTFSLYKFNKLSFKPNWAQLFESNFDIRKLPPKIKRNKSHTSKLISESSSNNGNTLNITSDNGSSLHNPSVSGESTVQFRYWNEFDNGSDFENDAAFTVDVDSSDDYQFLNNASIDWFYKLSNNFNNLMVKNVPWLIGSKKEDSTHYDELLSNPHQTTNQRENGYGSLESDVESLSEQIKLHQQSTFLSSLSLLSACFALLLTAVSLGITASIFNTYDDVSLSPVLVGILTMTMLISLFLGILAICLIMSCETKTWPNLIFVWGVFIGVTGFIIGGIGSVFGI